VLHFVKVVPMFLLALASCFYSFGFVECRIGCNTACEMRMSGIKILMTDNEIEFLVIKLCNDNTKRFLEFGSGGSTLAAAFCNVQEIVSLDNDEKWLQVVRAHNTWRSSSSHMQQLFVNTGKIAAFGRPTNNSSFADFIHYSHAVLQYSKGPFDVILVDGRFRVACALVSMQRMTNRSVLLLHDYERAEYHVLESVFEKVMQVDRLVQFKLPSVIDTVAINTLLLRYATRYE
jgi:hypothetical protein